MRFSFVTVSSSPMRAPGDRSASAINWCAASDGFENICRSLKLARKTVPAIVTAESARCDRRLTGENDPHHLLLLLAVAGLAALRRSRLGAGAELSLMAVETSEVKNRSAFFD